MNIKIELIIGAFGVIVVNLLIYNSYLASKTLNRKTTQIQKTANSTGLLENNILTTNQVGKHSKNSDCWIIIQNSVYVATDFLNLHPGGAKKFLPYCGKDATEAFLTKDGQGSHSSSAYNQLSQLKIGEIGKSQTVNESDIQKNVQKFPVNKKGESEDDD